MPPAPKPHKEKRLAIVLLIVAGAAGIWAVSQWQPKETPSASAKPAQAAAAKAAQPTPAAGVTTGTAASTPVPTGATAAQMTPRPDFQQRPLPVAQESGIHQWTAEDGRSPDVIHKLAHNDIEEKRMLDENARIKRRQLVYRKETVAAVMERARATGGKVDWLTLPGLDGMEIPVVITRADLAPSGQSGTITGHIEGLSDSMVTIAFKFGREAFTVVSPDGTNLQGHPREPGEIIITSFDPDTYLPLPGGEPIKTNQPLKIAK